MNKLKMITELDKKNIELDSIIQQYKEIEKKNNLRFIESKDDFSMNFKKAQSKPIHRWFKYKEGFSPSIVANFINRFNEKKNPIIFDPFGGIGTTVLESSLNGFMAYSNDVNPLSNYISRIKTKQYSEGYLNMLKEIAKNFDSIQFKNKINPPGNNTVINYFDDVTLDAILKIQYWINQIKNTDIYNIFNLALITNLENLSTHRKDGNGVKRKRNYSPYNSIDDIKTIILKTIDMFVSDIEMTTLIYEPNVLSQSSVKSYSIDQKADIVITSPPYANCFDYSKVYLVELWFSRFFKDKSDQKRFRENSIISHVHYKWNPRNEKFVHDLVNVNIRNYLNNSKLWDRKIPQMLVGYFSDIAKGLYELIPNLNNHATVGFIVGNSVYSGLPISTDLIIADIAEKLGYIVLGIETHRKLTPSSQQQKIMRDEDKIFLRESLVILKWKR